MATLGGRSPRSRTETSTASAPQPPQGTGVFNGERRLEVTSEWERQVAAQGSRPRWPGTGGGRRGASGYPEDVPRGLRSHSCPPPTTTPQDPLLWVLLMLPHRLSLWSWPTPNQPGTLRGHLLPWQSHPTWAGVRPVAVVTTGSLCAPHLRQSVSPALGPGEGCRGRAALSPQGSLGLCRKCDSRLGPPGHRGCGSCCHSLDCEGLAQSTSQAPVLRSQEVDHGHFCSAGWHTGDPQGWQVPTWCSSQPGNTTGTGRDHGHRLGPGERRSPDTLPPDPDPLLSQESAVRAFQGKLSGSSFSSRHPTHPRSGSSRQGFASRASWLQRRGPHTGK